MASLKDVEKVADDLESLAGELKKELKSGDFDRLIQIADQISEHADEAAQTFATVNDALMSRINGLSGRNSNQKTGSRS
jgi:ABC-type transporter Mla subunit MlaD